MAINSDKKLFEAHQRTSDALEEHDKVLEQLNRELFEAADYVKKILPQPITVGDIRTKWRYIPSTSLGGDAFGYHKLDDDHFAVYLIDVSGHGVGAALLSVSVINMLRSQSLPSTDFKDPEQVLRSLNIAFPSDANKDMFFTIWYGVYNRNTREMTYSSAGHPPAILCDSASSPDCKIDLLKTPNTVVGALGESTYTKSKCTVAEGDLLYIFSDGVYEVEKADGSMWCFREFTEYVKKLESESKSVLDRLYEHVKQIRKSDHLDDDFTILEVAFA
jgi:sigma-B regulation protein RsbU (phosphoserine phosphatase)